MLTKLLRAGALARLLTLSLASGALCVVTRYPAPAPIRLSNDYTVLADGLPIDCLCGYHPFAGRQILRFQSCVLDRQRSASGSPGPYTYRVRTQGTWWRASRPTRSNPAPGQSIGLSRAIYYGFSLVVVLPSPAGQRNWMSVASFPILTEGAFLRTHRPYRVTFSKRIHGADRDARQILSLLCSR
jgi:hypothetical protein